MHSKAKNEETLATGRIVEIDLDVRRAKQDQSFLGSVQVVSLTFDKKGQRFIIHDRRRGSQNAYNKGYPAYSEFFPLSPCRVTYRQNKRQQFLLLEDDDMPVPGEQCFILTDKKPSNGNRIAASGMAHHPATGIRLLIKKD